MHCLSLVRQHKVVVAVHDSRVLLLICLGWSGLQAQDGANVLLALCDGQVVPWLSD